MTQSDTPLGKIDAPPTQAKEHDQDDAPASAAPQQTSFFDDSADNPEDAPSFWEDLRDSIPPWLDEIVAISLLIFGMLSFLALFDASGAIVAAAWADILRQLFGYGGFLVAGGFFLLGVGILLPKIGVQVTLSPLRVLALEIAFLCALAVLHLITGETELRALARAGQGGGLIGWGLSFPVDWLVGRTLALVAFGVLLVLNLGIVSGVRRRHFSQWLKTRGEKLRALSERLRHDPEAAEAQAALENTQKIPVFSGRRMPLMRIRQKTENIPPALRPASSAEADTPENEAASSQPAHATTAEPEEEAVDLSNHPLFNPEAKEFDLSGIGERTGDKDDDGYELVRRPDGRLKRYFNLDALKEPKRVGRRERNLPALNILQDVALKAPDNDEINRNVVLIENTLLEFDIDIDVVQVQVGPTVTRYAVQPYRSGANASRTRLSKIASYANDLSLALSAKRLRLETPVPGTNFLGIEVPNKEPSTVALRSVYESVAYYEKQQKSESPLLVPLGRNVSGDVVSIDLAKMPHLLIAGTTGSGKSVLIAALATSLVLNNTPEKIKLVMLDPKMVELSRFNGMPHLLGPVETDTERIIGVLRWCTREMDRRYKLLEENAARNIDNYNARHGSRRRGGEYLPYLVILIDEIGDLMMRHPEETEKHITRLAQMARAVGMHLVVATQRPSVDVITGLIKANFPGRIAFSVASGVDSRVILDAVGAEHLLGQGDMLYQAPDAAGPMRVQGCLVTDEEVRQVVKHWRDWQDHQIEKGRAKAVEVGPWERGLTRREFLSETDPMLEDAIEMVVETQEASASMIQRRLGLGYPRAARIMDMLEELGIIGETVGGGRARRVLIPKGEDPFKRIIEKRLKDEQKEQAQKEKRVQDEFDL